MQYQPWWRRPQRKVRSMADFKNQDHLFAFMDEFPPHHKKNFESDLYVCDAVNLQAKFETVAEDFQFYEGRYLIPRARVGIPARRYYSHRWGVRGLHAEVLKKA